MTVATRKHCDGRLAWGLWLALGSACRPAQPEAPKDDATAPTPGPSDPAGAIEVALPAPEPTFAFESPAPRVRPAPAAVDDRNGALRAVARGNPEGAAAFLAPFVARQPSDAEARLALVRAYVAVGNLDGALAVASAGGTRDRTEELVLAEALVLERRGDAAAAVRVLEGARKDRAESLPIAGELVRLLHATGRGSSAESQALVNLLYDAYDAGKARTPETLLAVGQGALTRGSKGAFKDANMVLEEAEALAPPDGEAWIGDRIRLTRAAMFAEKYAGEEALATLELVLQRDPWHPDALAAAAQVKAVNLQFADAARLATETLAVNPTQALAHAVLAKIALIEGRREEARERIERHVLASSERGVSAPAVMAGHALMQLDDRSYAHWRDAALAQNPQNGAFYAELAEILGFLHLYPEAESILLDGVTRAPRDPYVRAARGLNLLRLGQETQARQELARAWEVDPFNERTRNVLELYEKSIDVDYTESRDGDLTLRLAKTDREFVYGGLVASVSASKRALDQAYGASGPLKLEFFAKPEEFSVRTVGVPSLGAVAVCFGPVITFIGPYFGTHNIDNVIRHELAHVYAVAKSRGRVPRWFTEGLSEWESELADPAWARESAALLRSAKEAGKLRTLGELELAFIRADSPAMMEVAYSTAAYAVRYLGTTYGREPLVRMLEGYGQGQTTEALTRAVLGREFSAIEREFEQWLHAELDRRVKGWAPSDDPDSRDKRDARFAQITAQIEAGDLGGAKQALQKLIAEGGDGFATRMKLAWLLAKGSAAAAAPHLAAAHAFYPESIEPIVALANLARVQGDSAGEIAYLKQTLAIDGEAFEPAARLLLLGLSTADGAAFDLALPRARAIAPLHPLSLAASALALTRAGDPAQGRAFLARAKEGLPAPGEGPGDTWAFVALAAHELGDEELARSCAAEAAKLGHLPAPTLERLRKLSAP